MSICGYQLGYKRKLQSYNTSAQMSLLVSLTALAHRIRKKKTNLDALKLASQDFQPSLDRGLQPLPCSLSDNIPQELFERFIDFLHDDWRSLSRCSIVCKAWFRACRFHLFRTLAVRPFGLYFDQSIDINCSIALRQSTFQCFNC